MNDHVERHYAARSLLDGIMAALDAAPSTGQPLEAADLAPLDQFHAGGVAATRQLAALAGLGAGQHVLDVGSGIGGPARFLAEACGCSVVGVDLTAEYRRIAEALTERLGLTDKVSFRTADALDLPFDDGCFDMAWTQHVAMNIADRSGLYREIHRVVRPGGKLALFDAVAGASEPLFPVPWARDASTSFLLTPEATRAVLERSGFALIEWHDATADAKRWFAARAGAPRPTLGLHLLMGPDFRTMAANFARSVMEGRIGLLMAVARKSPA
jgi:SAM-dependent methyltransferase